MIVKLSTGYEYDLNDDGGFNRLKKYISTLKSRKKFSELSNIANQVCAKRDDKEEDIFKRVEDYYLEEELTIQSQQQEPIKKKGNQGCEKINPVTSIETIENNGLNNSQEQDVSAKQLMSKDTERFINAIKKVEKKYGSILKNEGLKINSKIVKNIIKLFEYDTDWLDDLYLTDEIFTPFKDDKKNNVAYYFELLEQWREKGWTSKNFHTPEKMMEFIEDRLKLAKYYMYMRRCAILYRTTKYKAPLIALLNNLKNLPLRVKPFKEKGENWGTGLHEWIPIKMTIKAIKRTAGLCKGVVPYLAPSDGDMFEEFNWLDLQLLFRTPNKYVAFVESETHTVENGHVGAVNKFKKPKKTGKPGGPPGFQKFGEPNFHKKLNKIFSASKDIPSCVDAIYKYYKTAVFNYKTKTILPSENPAYFVDGKTTADEDDLENFRQDKLRHSHLFLKEFKRDILNIFFKKKILIGNLPNTQQRIYFEELLVAGDGNCGFTALGIPSRQDLIDTLLPLIEDEENRKFLSDEIGNVLELPLEEIPVSLKTKDYMDIINILRKEESEIDELKRNLIKTHKLENKNLNLDGLIAWLNENEEKQENKESDFKILSNKRLKLFQAEQNLKTYCSKKETVKSYLDEYKVTQWLGYKSALLYAKTKSITLYIFTKNDENSKVIECKKENSHIANNPTNTIYMLHTGGFTHFNLLQLNSNKKQIEPTQKEEIKKKDKKEDDSKPNQNFSNENIYSGSNPNANTHFQQPKTNNQQSQDSSTLNKTFMPPPM